MDGANMNIIFNTFKRLILWYGNKMLLFRQKTTTLYLTYAK